jgi:hypothetical protein
VGFVASEDENLKLFQVQMSSHYLGKNADKKILDLTAVYVVFFLIVDHDTIITFGNFFSGK